MSLLGPSFAALSYCCTWYEYAIIVWFEASGDVHDSSSRMECAYRIPITSLLIGRSYLSFFFSFINSLSNPWSGLRAAHMSLLGPSFAALPYCCTWYEHTIIVWFEASGDVHDSSSRMECAYHIPITSLGRSYLSFFLSFFFIFFYFFLFLIFFFLLCFFFPIDLRLSCVCVLVVIGTTCNIYVVVFLGWQVVHGRFFQAQVMRRMHQYGPGTS